MSDQTSEILSALTKEQLWQLFPITLKEYNVYYNEWYTEEEALIKGFLGDETIERISHIGSTAVLGLLAKPTVDILLEIKKDTDLAWLKTKFMQGGYLFSRQRENPPPKMMFMKGYLPTGFDEKVFHVHLRYLGDWAELYFRDYLRENTEAKKRYAELKQELAIQYRYDRDGYTFAKSKFIETITQKAKEKYKNRYIVKDS